MALLKLGYERCAFRSTKSHTCGMNHPDYSKQSLVSVLPVRKVKASRDVGSFDLLIHEKALLLCHSFGSLEIENWLTYRTQFVECGNKKTPRVPVGKSWKNIESNQSAACMHLFSSVMKMLQKIGIQGN